MADYYEIDRNCIDRLVTEWAKYGKIIISYDFDDTLYDFHERGIPLGRVEEALRRAQKIGAYFICSTSRNNDLLPFVRDWLKEHSIPCDKINEPLDFVKHREGKIYSQIHLDDRAGLGSALYILNQAMDIIQKKKDDNEHEY